MKHHKLPFSLVLDKKYNDVNIETFPSEWVAKREDRKSRKLMIDNTLHIELSKFKTYEISVSEIIDLGMRFALGKQEFRKLAAVVIEEKMQIKNKTK